MEASVDPHPGVRLDADHPEKGVLFACRFTGGRRAAKSPTKSGCARRLTNTVAHARTAHGDRTNAGHDLAFRQMSVAHQPLAAVLGQLVGMDAEQGRNLGLDRLHQQRSRAVEKHLGQRIGKNSWLGELENVSSVTAYHSFGGEVEASSTPTIRRLIPSCRHQLSPIAHPVQRPILARSKLRR